MEIVKWMLLYVVFDEIWRISFCQDPNSSFSHTSNVSGEMRAFASLSLEETIINRYIFKRYIIYFQTVWRVAGTSISLRTSQIQWAILFAWLRSFSHWTLKFDEFLNIFSTNRRIKCNILNCMNNFEIYIWNSWKILKKGWKGYKSNIWH